MLPLAFELAFAGEVVEQPTVGWVVSGPGHQSVDLRAEAVLLRLLVEGRSNRQIAKQLFISGKTVSAHVTNILAKLGVHSRLEAAAYARRLGMDAPT